MKKNMIEIFTVVMSMVVMASAVTACAGDDVSAGTKNNTLVSDTVPESKPNYVEMAMGEMVTAKVTAIDGNNITIQKSEMPEIGRGELSEDNEDRKSPADGDRIPSDTEGMEKPDDREMTPPENADSQTPSEMKGGGMGIGGNGGNMNFTGEVETITVADDVVIKKSSPRKMGEENSADTDEVLTIADISVDDVINILYDGDEIKEIKIRENHPMAEPDIEAVTAERK